MAKEKIDNESQIYGDIETLSQQTRMKILLEIFDIGKDKDKNEQRKKDFIELIGKYHQSGIRQRTENLGVIHGSDESKKKIHDQIMEIIRNISISQGLSNDQERLTEYLVRNRGEVEKMIETYFLGHNPADPRQNDQLHKALRGDSYFRSSRGKEND